MATSASSRPSPRSRGSHPRRSPDRPRSRSSSASPITTTRRRTGSTISRRSGRATASARRTSCGRSSRSRTAGSSARGHLGQGHIGATTVRVGPAAMRFPAVHLPDIQPEPEVGPIVGPVRPDRRRPDGPADAPAGPAQAVRAVLAVDRVDDARPDDQRRRHLEPRARRREPVPAPLDLRRRRARSSRSRRRSTSAKWFNHSFGDRTPWGDAGLAGRRRGGRVGARALALGRDHARRREAEDPDDRRRRHPRPAGRGRARTSS